MISPLNTVITNKTRERRRYRFTRFFISLAPQGDKEGGDTFRFNGDVFTLTDNDEEAQQLLYDHKLGSIELKYELDDSVNAEHVGKVAELSEKAGLTLLHRAELVNDDSKYQRVPVICMTDGNVRVAGAHVTINDSPSGTTDERGFVELRVPHSKTGYDLRVTKPGYTDYYQMRSVTSDNVPIQAELYPARGKQTFLVLGAKGVPLADATVTIERVGSKITDFRGIAEFDNVPLTNKKYAGSKVNPKYPSSGTTEINGGKFKYHVYYPGYNVKTGELPKEGTAARQWLIKLIYDWTDTISNAEAVEPSENQ